MSITYYLFAMAKLTAEERRIFPIGGHVETAEAVEIVQHLDIIRLGWQARYRINEWPIDDYLPPPILAVMQLLHCGRVPVEVNRTLIAHMRSRLSLPAPPGFVDAPESILGFLEQHQGEEIGYFSI